MNRKVFLSIALALAMSLNMYAGDDGDEKEKPEIGPTTFPIPHRAPRQQPAVTVKNIGNGTAIIQFNKDAKRVEVEFYRNGIFVGFEGFVSVEASSILTISADDYSADSFAVIVNGKEVYAGDF